MICNYIQKYIIIFASIDNIYNNKDFSIELNQSINKFKLLIKRFIVIFKLYSELK
jgi:hypothetical protein